jgi:hypothetical protein
VLGGVVDRLRERDERLAAKQAHGLILLLCLRCGESIADLIQRAVDANPASRFETLDSTGSELTNER